MPPAAAKQKKETPQQLLAWLQRGALDEQVEALVLLEALAAKELPRSEIIASGAVKTLLRFLPMGTADRSSNIAETRLAAEARLHATKSLENLLLASAGRATIVNARGVAMIVALLSTSPSEGSMQCATLEHAILALRNMAAEDGRGREQVVKDGGLPLLVELLSSTVPACQVAAARALEALAGNEVQCRMILEAGALRPVMNLLTMDKAEGREWSASVLRALACSNQNRNAIIDSGSLPLLVTMLSDEAAEAQSAAAGALAALSTIEELVPTVEELMKEGDSARPPPPDTAQIVTAGAVERLVVLLSTGTTDGRANAASALSQLSELSKSGLRHHDRILQAGALTPLVGLLAEGEDAKSRAWAASALRHLAASVDEQQIERSIPPTRLSRDAVMATIRSYCL